MSKTMTAARDEYRRSMYTGHPRNGTEVGTDGETGYYYPAMMTTSSLIPIAGWGKRTSPTRSRTRF
jgi:hypothetical protein